MLDEVLGDPHPHPDAEAGGWGLPARPVVADAGYGDATEFRLGLQARGLPYVVAVKATTSERLGFTGREEGIAAVASATIRLPWDDKGWGDKGWSD